MKQQRTDNLNFRFSSLVQLLFGFALIVFGIADIVEHVKEFESGFPSKSALGIWMGFLISITGTIGCVASLPSNRERTILINVYLIASIVSGVLGLIIADCYIVSLVYIKREGDCKNMGKPITQYYGTIPADTQCEVRRKLAIIMLVMAICEILGAIFAIYRYVQMYLRKREYDLQGHSDGEVLHSSDPDRLETVSEIRQNPESPTIQLRPAPAEV